jgi:rhamnose utilization protein RhaD (predicted bifunctional aldolase and dehydrogenase)
MNFQRPVTNISNNNKVKQPKRLDQLIYRLNLLGSDLSITNFGGGTIYHQR